jgi:UDP-glucuronate decarboxylase
MTRCAIVAGAAGFVGSHLTERLLSEGWTVTGVDNFLTGRTENLVPLRKYPLFKFVKGDVRKRLGLPDAEAIFHLASPASPPHYQRVPIHTLEVNGFGTAHLLAHAESCGARFVMASTSEVYGDPEVHPQDESYWGHVNPIGPRSCYDEGKRFAEALCVAWATERHVDARIARIFNTYGPRMAPDDGRIISNFFMQGWRGDPITVYGTGDQTRSFCYVSDLVDGLLALRASDEVKGPVNLGNPDTEMTVLHMAERISKLTGGRSSIVHVARGKDDPERRRPDISKARKVLGWRPRTSLARGLSQTSEYFRQIVAEEGR